MHMLSVDGGVVVCVFKCVNGCVYVCVCVWMCVGMCVCELKCVSFACRCVGVSLRFACVCVGGCRDNGFNSTQRGEVHLRVEYGEPEVLRFDGLAGDAGFLICLIP